MPLGWAWLLGDARVAAAPALAHQAPVAPQANLPTDLGPITIRRAKVSAQVVPYQHIVLTDAEVAYGESVIIADRIELYRDGNGAIRPGSGIAKGHVQLTDPIGLMSADEIDFNWLDHTAQVSNAVATVEGIRLQAFHANINETEWKLDGVRAELAVKHPLAYLMAAHATIRPGRGITGYGLSTYVLGNRLFGFHSLGYQPNSHFGGDRYPVPTFSGDHGVGVRFRPLYLVDQRTAVEANYMATQSELPSYGVVAARSFLPKGEAHGLIVPRSDMDYRFDFGYFDNLGVETPTKEHELVAEQRNNISADVQYNVQAFDRKGNEIFAKPFEATFERSLAVGNGFALLTDNTVQEIHSLGGSDHTRFLDYSSLEIPVVRLAPKITLRTRLDGATYQTTQENFSWFHSQFGLVYRPNEDLRFGAAYVAGKEYGVPLYQADQLYSKNGIDLRGDFTIGPRTFSLLFKYDTDRGSWYDREFLISQAVGPFEAFARYRTFPSQFIIGAQLRVDSVFNELLKRNPNRPTAPAKEVD